MQVKFLVATNQVQLIRNNSVVATFSASELSPDSNDQLALFTRGTVIGTDLPDVTFEVHTPSINGVPLSYTRFGTYADVTVNLFNVNSSKIDPLVVFAFGQPTPQGSMPTSGTASYDADIYGAVVIPNGTSTQFYTLGDGDGSATFNVNFGSGVINTLISLETDGGDFGDMTGTGAILSGGPAFNGNLTGSATGAFTGAFFGPGAEEMGYVFQAKGSNFLTYGNVFGVEPAPPPP